MDTIDLLFFEFLKISSNIQHFIKIANKMFKNMYASANIKLRVLILAKS